MKAEYEELVTYFILSYAVFTASFVWYLYWILYDVIVWNKSFLQVNIINYFGLTAMVGLILYGAKIATHLLRKPMSE